MGERDSSLFEAENSTKTSNANVLVRVDKEGRIIAGTVRMLMTQMTNGKTNDVFILAPLELIFFSSLCSPS
jgi:hypothetical protein